jgi:hypothetical protein
MQMIRNISFNDKELKEEIIHLVGRSFSLLKRFKLGGIGSQRLVSIDASHNIRELFELDNKTNFCNIELREKGIILHFRSRLETFGWMVPYYALSVFKSENSYSLYAKSDFVKLKAAHNSALNHRFIQKLLKLKNESNGHFTQVDQL